MSQIRPIKKGILFTKARIDSNGCICFILPKEMTDKMNRMGTFQIDFEEIDSVETKYGKTVVIKS